ncbi:MAG TPA: helix-turn-helix domain-containing protein [Firmicutes bacterium]|nr:helix-turn-helix domain-containing protein [Bacillota bacterium]
MKNNIGEKIRKRRKELNYSQSQLAQILGYKSRSSINKIEMGENDIPQSKLKNFAEALKCTQLYLLGLDEECGLETYILNDPDADEYAYPEKIKVSRKDILIISKAEQEHLKKLRCLSPKCHKLVDELVDTLYNDHK